jgi:hypothetical protein
MEKDSKKAINPIYAKKGEYVKNPIEKAIYAKKGKRIYDKSKVNENVLKFIDLMISENYKEAHKFLEIVIQNKIKKTIAEAAKKDLFPKADDKNPKFLKKQGKKSSK